MAEESFQEKTEKATPKRRQEAREKGNIPRSIEVNSAVILLIVSLFFIFLGSKMFSGVIQLGRSVFGNMHTIDLSVQYIPGLVQKTGIAFSFLVGPFMLSILVAGVLSNVMQSGLTFSAESLQPKFSKINPLSGFKKMFALRSLVELVKNIFKLSIIGYIGYITIKGETDSFFALVNQDVMQIVAFVGALTLKMFLRVGAVFIILAGLDFAYQRFEFEKELKMTKQEIKEEYKQTEGDPLIKSRIRSIQRERARSRMMQDVATADVVVTNPTHVAVALKYDSENMGAPKVVAKGMRKIAERIKQIARENGVPVIEKPLVARMLYKSAEIGQEIPAELYQVVAELLAFVYQSKNKKL